ncbi:MAG TPA: aminomethyl-transferring glycine dehydrogenase subunit GcvPB [Candidatus Saccharimonadales bacterium]|nr:aminomethyl-transferring glycine dehydrogenase subunit GcvPB [Candidatus Saccharimonadales bacterium]
MSATPEPMWAGPEPLLFELAGPDSPGPLLPGAGVDTPGVADGLPSAWRRRHRAQIPAVNEPDLARHFGRLGRRNHNLQQGAYPLGSCTMKYNPAVNEQAAALDGFADIHPLQPVESIQGALELMWELEQILCRITGMHAVSLQPAAGAHGEWTGLRMIQAHHLRNEDHDRTEVIIPDTAHGTNPASAAQCGLAVVTVRSASDGTVDLDDFRAKLSPSVAAVMLTNPNTLGIFERNIEAMARLAHEAGALLYYDGANLNALVGVARPGDMGFDVVHLNLHKTFSTPHGGGGPGAGPVGVSAELADFLPLPRIVTTDGGFDWDYKRPHSIGKVRSFYGNFGMLVRAYAYIRAYGDGISQVAQDAVLAARYLRLRLEPWLPVAVSGDSFHEFVASPKRSTPAYSELRALDIAKRMIDYGVYPPTVYFPMTVPEAMMFEPTETESKRSLDQLAGVVQAIMEEGAKDPEVLHSAPHQAPVGRVDEVTAARHPKLRWRPDPTPD